MTIMPFPAAKRIGEADLSPEFSDDALALEFTDRYLGELRYVSKRGAWFRWDGMRWKLEETLAAFDMARALARDFANACTESRDKPKIASAKTVAAIERLARADRRHAATIEAWDADPWLLNTPGGIVELRTGATVPHDPARYLTKITAVAPGGNCPRWHRFLAEITAGNVALQDFLQRVAGYALTGSTREHALFFAYGTGANGKGLFINTVAGVLADYAKTAPMETFTASQTDRHPTDLAGLVGARLVTAQETESGKRWAESRIKMMTGGDAISARFMRQDFFEFVPQFKLLIAGSHKPGLRGVDEAIRRRFYLIPFTVTIPAEQRDKDLFEKLKSEWGGILQWVIEGCLAWQRDGLSPPTVVREATDAYLAAEDAIGQWIEDCCVRDPGYAEEATLLFSCWKTWADHAGEFAASQKRFSQALEDQGFIRDHHSSTRRAIFRGLALKPDHR